MRRFLFRLLNVVRSDRSDRELSREIAAHLALMEEDLRRRGRTPDEARREARLALGGIEQTKERHRDARAFTWVDDARRDAMQAVRLLRRHPAFALTAALSLAIGIGANTAVFTVANALLFRAPVGVAEPERLVDIGTRRGDGGFNPTSYPVYQEIRRRATTLVDLYAQTMFPAPMGLDMSSGRVAAEPLFGLFVTTTYFSVLGAHPAAGRLFGPGDSDEPGASPVVVLSHGFWTRRFGADPSVVGRTLRLNGQPFTIVGVASERFQGTGILAGDLWLPLGMSGHTRANGPQSTIRRGGSLVVGGRLKPGVTMEQAAAEMDALGLSLARDMPNAAVSDRGAAATLGLVLLRSSRSPGNGGLLAALAAGLMIIVSLVLIVACANVAGILLARSTARRREIAVRLAIGAGRMRLVRQLLTETLVLFLLGGAAGLLLARILTSALVPLLPSLPFPISVTLALDGRVLSFTTGLSFVAAFLSGLAPALQASKADVVRALNDASQGPSGRSRLRGAFVVVQVALSLVLVIAAGLFVRAIRHAGMSDPGFDPRGVELASIDLSMDGQTDATGPAFARGLIERVRQRPGVEAATLARVLPGGFEGIGLGIVSAPDSALPASEPFIQPSWNIVEPGYFATLRIPIVAGRDFSAADLAGTPRVAIVSEGIARRLWPGLQAVGKHLTRPAPDNAPAGAPAGPRMLLVVGVVRDVKSSSLIDGLADSFVYLPLQQEYASHMTSRLIVAARSASPGRRLTREIASAVAAASPNLPIIKAETLDDSTALGLVPQRVVASVAGSLGSIGLLLAAVGIYGLTAYLVARRTREIGIRLSLGARRRDIFVMVMRQGMALAAVGLAIGLALAAVLSRLLSVFLFGLPPMDPVTFGGAAALFLAAGLTASYVPARRATRLDPLSALRHD